MFADYSPQTNEPRWQHSWEQAGLYRAVETGDRKTRGKQPAGMDRL